MSEEKSLTEWADEKALAVHDENQEIARTNRLLRSKVREHEVELDVLRERVGLYEGLDDARLEPPVWKVPTKKGAIHNAIPCFGLGDLHWGEVVNPDRIDGVNKYNVAIAAARTRLAFEKVVTMARRYMAGLTFDGIQVFLTGDMVGGIIHEELRATNQEEMTESALGTAEALSAGLHMLADEFGTVKVSAVVGNHSRMSLRMPTKNPQECVDWLVYRMVARDLRDDSRVTISSPKALGTDATVYNTRYYLTHGTQFKGGSGISGMASPLLLGAHRATRRAAAAGKPFDVMVLGHFHQAFFWPSKGLIVCGCPKGYDEYARSMEFEPEPAQATLWITTPEHGITGYYPIFCSDRKSEGW